MEEAEQPEWKLAADGGHLRDQEEVERKGAGNGLGGEGWLGLRTEDTQSSKCGAECDVLLTVFTLKENSEYKQHKLVFS